MDEFPPGGGGYSEGGRGGGRATGFRGTPDNAKTKICNRWEEGECRFGERCNFAHGAHELRPSFPPDGMGRGHASGYPSRGRGFHPYGHMHGGGRGYPGGRGYGGGYPGMPAYQGYNMGMGMGMGMGQGMGQPPGPSYNQRPAGMADDVWTAQGCPIAGPNQWYMYRTKDTGEVYFHNHSTGVTTWERPVEWPGP